MKWQCETGVLKTKAKEVERMKKQNKAFRNLTTIDLFYFLMCEDPAWIETHWNSIWLRAKSHMTSHYTRGPVTTLLHGFWKCLGTLFVWALTIPWSQALGLTCEGGPNQIWLVCEGLFFWRVSAKNRNWSPGLCVFMKLNSQRVTHLAALFVTQSRLGLVGCQVWFITTALELCLPGPHLSSIYDI
jgi:hypothetical protein